MLKNINIGGILLILSISIFVVFFGFGNKISRPANKVYMVYLDGKKIGMIKDKNTLLTMIDEEQEEFKTMFGVDKVYPPEGLEAVEYTTYNKKVNAPEDIYNLIASSSTFTIKGYTITIKSEDKDPVYINILNKEDLEPALLDAVRTFIDSDSLEAYINNTQIEIKDKGKKIENVYFEEKITIKDAYLSVDEEIITNKNDLTKFLLFGTLEQHAQYTVKEGDTVEKVAYANKLSSENLLILNPELSSEKALLSPGQKLSIGMINPLFSVVETSMIIDDFESAYGTVIEKTPSMYIGQSKVKQEGVKGKNRVTEKVVTKNGAVQSVDITATTLISSPVNKIVLQGTTPSYNFNYVPPAASSTDWGWPTISPYLITSAFGYRWGSFHGAIDIGTSLGTPVFSSTEGTVIKTNATCPLIGYLGNSCGGSYGNYVEVQTPTGLIIYYAHMSNLIKVTPGQTVTKGQIIGYIGSSGSSTGPHLHFEIRSGGQKLNPCSVAFAC